MYSSLSSVGSLEDTGPSTLNTTPFVAATSVASTIDGAAHAPTTYSCASSSIAAAASNAEPQPASAARTMTASGSSATAACSGEAMSVAMIGYGTRTVSTPASVSTVSAYSALSAIAPNSP